MIVETAHMTVHPGAEADFRAALREAAPLVLESPGCLGMQVHRGVERPSTFLLVISWASLAAHVDGFRGSDSFTRWRELLGPFFAEPPVVEHWTPEADVVTAKG